MQKIFRIESEGVMKFIDLALVTKIEFKKGNGIYDMNVSSGSSGIGSYFAVYTLSEEEYKKVKEDLEEISSNVLLK